jgi:hypothetical protein
MATGDGPFRCRYDEIARAVSSGSWARAAERRQAGCEVLDRVTDTGAGAALGSRKAKGRRNS